MFVIFQTNWMIKTMDDLVGHLMRTLQDNNLSECVNVIIVSDHGLCLIIIHNVLIKLFKNDNMSPCENLFGTGKTPSIALLRRLLEFLYRQRSRIKTEISSFSIDQWYYNYHYENDT